MHRAARQRGIGAAGGHMILVGQLAADQRGLRFVQMRQHGGHRFVPPGQAAQVGLAPVEVARGQVRARQHGAHGRAVGRAGVQLALAVQPVDQRGGFAAHRVQQVVLAAGHARAFGLGLRVGHRHAVLRQVLHQVQVKRQLRVRQALEQGQHPFTGSAGDEVVGVLDAALDAAQRGQLAQVQRVQQGGGLAFGDFGVDGHRRGP